MSKTEKEWEETEKSGEKIEIVLIKLKEVFLEYISNIPTLKEF